MDPIIVCDQNLRHYCQTMRLQQALAVAGRFAGAHNRLPGAKPLRRCSCTRNSLTPSIHIKLTTAGILAYT